MAVQLGHGATLSLLRGVIPMSLYFFTICELDRTVKEDLHGMSLPNAADALSYARHTIDELRCEVGYDNPRLIMIVQDNSQHTIWSLPFLPACA
jgi:hypothetical protein